MLRQPMLFWLPGFPSGPLLNYAVESGRDGSPLFLRRDSRRFLFYFSHFSGRETSTRVGLVPLPVYIL
jgi:hypothetical protein